MISHQLPASNISCGDPSGKLETADKYMSPYHQSPTWETRIQRNLNVSNTLVIDYSDALYLELGQRAGHAQCFRPVAGIVHEFQQPGAENLHRFTGRCTLIDI